MGGIFGRRKLQSDFQLFCKVRLMYLDNREYDECKCKLYFELDKKKRSDESHKSICCFFFLLVLKFLLRLLGY